MGGRFSSLLLYGELQAPVSDFALSEQIAFADLTSNKMEDVSPIISSAKHYILCYFHFHLKYIESVNKLKQPNVRISSNFSITTSNCSAHAALKKNRKKDKKNNQKKRSP